MIYTVFSLRTTIKITVWVEILALGMHTLGETGCSCPFSPFHVGFSNARAFELPSS